MAENRTLTALPGIRVGHWTDLEGGTGCTVILTPQGARASVEIRGLAPGTRELALLDPVRTVQEVHAIVLTGGSAFGLAAAQGVVQWLEERGYGYATGFAKVPIVPAAVVYDLNLGNPKARPTPEAGYAACEAATSDPVPEGTVGAGTGVTVGKLLGLERAVKSGVGSAWAQLPEGQQVAALAVVNAVGDVYDPETGRLVAGVRDDQGRMVGARQVVRQVKVVPPFPRQGENTTLVVLATDVGLTKTELKILAAQGHVGMARAIDPIHTPFDGDLVFALSVGNKPKPAPVLLEAWAAWVTAQAIVRAVEAATGLHGIPAIRDLSP